MLGSMLTLRDGHAIPSIGVGLYKVDPVDVAALVDASCQLGYRLFDTAAMYGNEQALGRALAAAALDRSRYFVTTKVLTGDHGFARTRAALARSLELLGLDHVDLYLIHWPAPRQNRFVETWEAMISLREEGLVGSIGVSNFHVHHLDRLAAATDVTPVINQVECHPWLPQNELRAVHDQRRIVTQAWSPLARGQMLADPTVCRLSERLGVSPAQLVLAWHLHRNMSVIPKTNRVARLVENAQSVGLPLEPDIMAALDALETGKRTGADPDDRD